MNRSTQFPAIASLTLIATLASGAFAAETAKPTSYTNVIEEDFGAVMARMKAQKAQIQQRHKALLDELAEPRLRNWRSLEVGRLAPSAALREEAKRARA